MNVYAIFLSFFLGSIPFAAITTKLLYRKSILQMGDKNPGARNVYQQFGQLAGGITLFLDVGKGMLLVFILQQCVFPVWQILLMVFIGLLGHAFSPFLLFRGGQGVAMLVGSMLQLFPIPVTIFIILFGILQKKIHKFDLCYSIAVVLLLVVLFLFHPLSWNERLLLMGLFLFPLTKRFLFPKKGCSDQEIRNES
jgi:acyl phosphate:glycerol-3-phosphate acyltransferase